MQFPKGNCFVYYGASKCTVYVVSGTQTHFSPYI